MPVLTPTAIDAFIQRLADEPPISEVPEDAQPFCEAMQTAALIASTHETQQYGLRGLLTDSQVGVGTMRRYILGTSAPHWKLRHLVLRGVGGYLSLMVAHYREEAQRASDQLRAFNLVIQQPDFDSDRFFEHANRVGSLSEAIDEAAKGGFKKE